MSAKQSQGKIVIYIYLTDDLQSVDHRRMSPPVGLPKNQQNRSSQHRAVRSS